MSESTPRERLLARWDRELKHLREERDRGNLTEDVGEALLHQMEQFDGDLRAALAEPALSGVGRDLADLLTGIPDSGSVRVEDVRQSAMIYLTTVGNLRAALLPTEPRQAPDADASFADELAALAHLSANPALSEDESRLVRWARWNLRALLAARQALPDCVHLNAVIHFALLRSGIEDAPARVAAKRAVDAILSSPNEVTDRG
jgi:hypothetical protein